MYIKINLKNNNTANTINAFFVTEIQTYHSPQPPLPPSQPYISPHDFSKHPPPSTAIHIQVYVNADDLRPPPTP